MTAALLLAILAADPSTLIQGQVIDSITRQPIPKAAVDLVRPSATRFLALSTRTDENGRFQFPAPGLGACTLSTSKAGYLRKFYGPGIVLNQENPERSVTLALEPAASISGHIADEDGAALAGITLTLWRKEAAAAGSWQDAMHTTTNSRGDFAQDNIEPGTYLLSAQVSSAAHGVPAYPVREGDQDLAFPPHFYPGVTEANEATPLILKPGHSSDGLHFVMRRSPVFRVEGRFSGNPGWKAADIDLVRSPESQDSYPAIQDLTHFRATSPDTPNFTFFNVFPGAYRLRVFDRSQLQPKIVGLLDFVVGAQHRSDLVIPPITFTALHIKLSVEGPQSPGAIKLDIRPTQRNLSIYTSESAVLTPGESQSFHSLYPGRYKISPSYFDRSGFIKSIQSRSETNVDAGFDLPASGQEITIVYSTRVATLKGEVKRAKKTSLPGYVLLLPEDTNKRSDYIVLDVEGEGTFHQERFRPAAYLALAFEELDRTRLSDPEYLKPFLEHATKLTLGEDETKSVTLRQIPASPTVSESSEGPRP